MTTALCLLVRPIVAGATKTRLIPALGAEGASRLYGAFVRDAARAVQAVPDLQPTLWIAGSHEHSSLDALELAFPRRSQPENATLGQRLVAALSEGCAACGAAVAIGSDAPTLPARYLELACLALTRRQCVLGPTADGGFYAIGVQQVAVSKLGRALSRVRWSSSSALQDAAEGALAAGLDLGLLPPWYDVDDRSDLHLLRVHLALCPEAAPATAAALATLSPSEPQQPTF
jgi:rSAM/selenodomain-associated transferase 1